MSSSPDTLCTPVAVSLASGMSDHRATEMPPPPLDDGVRLTSRLADNKFEDGASVGCLSPFSPRQTIPIAVGPGSSRWVDGDRLQSCPSCDVDFSSLHKHVTKRHCRRCGGVFCYTCTYDKATLRTPSCLPFSFLGSKASVHVCVDCYDHCPPPEDGRRRCRFCHQRVRLPHYVATILPTAHYFSGCPLFCPLF